MSELYKNSVLYLQKIFPTAPVIQNEYNVVDAEGNELIKMCPMIAQDPKSGIKQRAIAVKNLGERNELSVMAENALNIFSEIDSSIYVKMGNSLNPRGHEIDTNQMVFSAKIILYTNKLFVPVDEVIEAFNAVNILIEVVDESEMHKTLFISYGDPDQKFATEINSRIKSKGVKTWFFPDDAKPGEKLHRMMHDGINTHDKVLLICSKNSLSRNGVLNEIERILEREAREGGSEILIPITLDDFVYSEWQPERADIAAQVRARVIFKIDFDPEKIESCIQRLVDTLKGKG